MEWPNTTDSSERRGGRRHLQTAAASLCAGAAGLLGVTVLAPAAPAAGASPAHAPQTSRVPAPTAGAASPRSQATEAAGCGTKTGSSAAGSGSVSPRGPLGASSGTASPAGTRHPDALRKGDIQGSGASPVLPRGHGPLSDQLFVTAGTTDATLMGNLGHSGPAAGGLRTVPTVHGLSNMATGTGGYSAHGPTGRVMHGDIEGSGASPAVQVGHGPLSDQLWVNPGTTDATLMGNCGRTGPAAGGLRKTGAGPYGAPTRAAAVGSGTPTGKSPIKNRSR